MSKPTKKLKELIDQAVRRFRQRGSEPPEDPYSYVGAPKKPRLPQRSASAVAELE